MVIAMIDIHAYLSQHLCGTEPVCCGVGLQYSIFFRLLCQMLVINPCLHHYIPVEVLTRDEFIYHIQ